MVKRGRKHRFEASPRVGLAIALAVLSLATLGGLVFLVFKTPARQVAASVVSHGPRVSDLAAWVSRPEASQTVDQPAANTTAAASAVGQPGAKNTTTGGGSTAGQSSSQPAATVVSTAGLPLGIAAGGGLVNMSQSSLNTYFQHLKDLGITWVRWDMQWSTVQASGQGSFDWGGFDRVADTANRYGIKSVGIIAYTPSWARRSGCNDTACAPADTNTFAVFAGQAAARYSARGIHTWEIWNEPNFAPFWQPTADAGKYTTMLKQSYAQIKQADPSAVVMSGGLAASADEGGSISPIRFIQQMYDSGAHGSFDAVALHPYSYPVVPSYQAPWNFWQQMSSIRSLMVNNGDGDKKIWPTELGAPTNGPGSPHGVVDLSFTYPSDYMTELAQAEIAADALAQYKQNAGWLGTMFWYSLQDLGASTSTTENFYGLLRSDGSKKPAYDVIFNSLH